MMASIEPVWDGNETWLVMGGSLLLAAFPAGYYVSAAGLLPADHVHAFCVDLPWHCLCISRPRRPLPLSLGFCFRRRLASCGFCQGFVLGGLIVGSMCRVGYFTAAHSVS